MKKQRQRGLFLTFEGIDGCGKSTQVRLFADYLERRGIKPVITREPGGTRLGEGIRKLLLPRASQGIDPRTEVLLLFASRAQNVAENILPALRHGSLVLCDRFTDATLAYQGHGRGLDLEFIRALHRFACQGLNPNLTFVIDINPRTSVARARERNSSAAADEGRFEQEGAAFHQRVRSGYRRLAKEEPARVKLIPGEDSIQAVHHRIVAVAKPLLDKWQGGEHDLR